jgi:hypothetical protein
VYDQYHCKDGSAHRSTYSSSTNAQAILSMITRTMHPRFLLLASCCGFLGNWRLFIMRALPWLDICCRCLAYSRVQSHVIPCSQQHRIHNKSGWVKLTTWGTLGFCEATAWVI